MNTFITPLLLSLALALVSTISHADEVIDTEISTDNSTVAIALRKNEEARPYVNIYDVTTGKKISTITEITKSYIDISGMALNHDGSYLVVDDFMDDLVGVWNTHNPQEKQFKQISNVDEVFFKPKNIDDRLSSIGNNIGNNSFNLDEEELVIVGDNSIIRSNHQLQMKKIWRFGTDSLFRSTNLEGANMVLSSDFRYLPNTRYGKFDFKEKNGKLFFRYENNGDSFVVLDTDSKKEIGVIDVHQFSAPNLANPPIDDEIWIHDDEVMRIFNSDTLQLTSILNFAPMDVDDIDDIDFSPDGKSAVFVVGRGDGNKRDLLFLDIQKSDKQYTIQKVVTFDEWIHTVKYLDDNRLFIFGSKPMIWDIDKGKAVMTYVSD